MHRALVEGLAWCVSQGIVSLICRRLTRLFDRTSPLSKSEAAVLERRALCDCLATISLIFSISESDASLIIKLLKDASVPAQEQPSEQPSASVPSTPAPSSVAVTAKPLETDRQCDLGVLCICILSLLDSSHLTLSLDGGVTDYAAPPLVHASSAASSLNSLPVPYSHITSLARSLGRRDDIDHKTASIWQHPTTWSAIEDLAKLISAEATPDLKDQHLSVLADLIVLFLNLNEGEGEMRVKRLRSNPESYTGLLKAMTAVYEAIPSSYALKWWEGDNFYKIEVCSRLISATKL